MSVLREYHAEMGRLIVEHEGTLERFTGDGMMIFFNDPVPVPNPDERAVRMALAMRERVAELIGKWRKLGYELDLSIGIAQGYATIGAIGFEGRWDYGAIGSVTNLAARLCGEAKPGEILISKRVMARTEGAARGRLGGRAFAQRFPPPDPGLQRPGTHGVEREPCQIRCPTSSPFPMAATASSKEAFLIRKACGRRRDSRSSGCALRARCR